MCKKALASVKRATRAFHWAISNIIWNTSIYLNENGMRDLTMACSTTQLRFRCYTDFHFNQSRTLWLRWAYFLPLLVASTFIRHAGKINIYFAHNAWLVKVVAAKLYLFNYLLIKFSSSPLIFLDYWYDCSCQYHVRHIIGDSFGSLSQLMRVVYIIIHTY